MLNKIYDYFKGFIKECYKELIFITIVALLCLVELPYVIYTPGGLVNLNKRVEITNGYEPKGTINMTYVSLAKPNIPNILLSKVIKNWDLEKAEDMTYDDDTVSETLKKDKYTMKEAYDNAVLVAYNLVGKKVDIKKYHNYVLYITDEAKTGIKEFDEIISINGEEVTSLDNMRSIVNKYKENDIVNVKVLRDKKEVMTTAKLFKVDNSLKIGVVISTNIDYEADPDISIKVRKSESGPSGGAMMALAIYNELTKEDITKGKTISGTGTIDKDGNIGEIGGVKYKLMGAVKKKSDIFICPKENYEEAKKVAKDFKYDIKIITGDNIKDIINTLKEI